MGYCYVCDLEKDEDISMICNDCLKKYECKIHGQNGDVTCWECRDRLMDVIHLSTMAAGKKYNKEVKAGIITDDPNF